MPRAGGSSQRKEEMKTVSIFGSSLPREGSGAYEEARRLGHLLAKAGMAVCNGGYGGLMEASARGAREARRKGRPTHPAAVRSAAPHT